MRALAVLIALVLAFGAAVMILVAIDIGETASCGEDYQSQSDAEKAEDDFSCVDASSAQKSVLVVLAWASGIVGALAVLAALVVAFTGARTGLLARLAGVAVVLVGLYFIVGAF